MAVLIGMSADIKGQTHTIEGDETSIGRSEGNTIVISSPSVSGRHAVIAYANDQYVMRDLGSTNGTRVNGRDVTEAPLNPKDVVQIGYVDFVFHSEDIPLSEAEAIYNKTEIVEAAGPAVKPQSFNSISPFGARSRENQSLWITLIALLGVATLLLVGFFVYRLFTI